MHICIYIIISIRIYDNPFQTKAYCHISKNGVICTVTIIYIVNNS